MTRRVGPFEKQYPNIYELNTLKGKLTDRLACNGLIWDSVSPFRLETDETTG